MISCISFIKQFSRWQMTLNKNFSKYIQGQQDQLKIREYFYYIDHQGMLFMDDAKIKNFTSCFKDVKFLAFFFKRIQLNKTDRYNDFPFISLCGREKNYIRCDDVPFVYTHVSGKCLYYGHAGEHLKEEFFPDKIRMNQHTGRVYHPAPERAGGIGLIKSSLAIDFSSRFQFQNGEASEPTHFHWDGQLYPLQ